MSSINFPLASAPSSQPIGPKRLDKEADKHVHVDAFAREDATRLMLKQVKKLSIKRVQIEKVPAGFHKPGLITQAIVQGIENGHRPLTVVTRVQKVQQSLRLRTPQLAFPLPDIQSVPAPTAKKNCQALLQAAHAALKEAATRIEQGQQGLDSANAQTLLQSLIQLPLAEAINFLKGIKQQNPVGTLTTASNLTRAIFQLPPRGTGALHHAINQTERLLTGHNKLHALLEAKAPLGTIARYLALHPTSYKELLQHLKNTVTTPNARHTLARLEHTLQQAETLFASRAHFKTNSADSPAALRDLVAVAASPESDTAQFIARHLLHPQLPGGDIHEAERFFQFYDTVKPFVGTATQMNKPAMGAVTEQETAAYCRMLGRLFVFSQDNPKTALLLNHAIAKLSPPWRETVSFVAALPRNLQLLENGSPAQVAKFFESVPIQTMRLVIDSIRQQNSKTRLPYDWKALDARLAMCQQIKNLPTFLRPGESDRAIQAFNFVWQTYTSTNQFGATFLALVKDQALQNLFICIQKDHAVNSDYGVTLAPLLAAQQLRDLVLAKDVAAFKQALRECTNPGQIESPQARFAAIQAACAALIIPTLTPENQALMQQYFAVVRAKK